MLVLLAYLYMYGNNQRVQSSQSIVHKSRPLCKTELFETAFILKTKLSRKIYSIVYCIIIIMHELDASGTHCTLHMCMKTVDLSYNTLIRA